MLHTPLLGSPATRRRRRGAPPGNLNALKHGRRSKPVRALKRISRQLQKGVLESAIPDKEFENAFAWTRNHNAALSVAAMRRAAQVRWFVAATDALERGLPQPAPPIVIFSPYELRIMKLYMEQRSIIRNMGGAGILEEQPPLPNLEEALKATIHALEEWQLLSSALEDPVLIESAGVNPADDLPRFRAALASLGAAGTSEPSPFAERVDSPQARPGEVPPAALPLHAMERAIVASGDKEERTNNDIQLQATFKSF